MIVVGLVGYVKTPRGLRALNAVWAEHLSDECRRRFYKNWYKAKKRAFTKYAKKYSDGKKEIEAELAQIKKHCTVVRVIAHTQVRPEATRRSPLPLLSFAAIHLLQCHRVALAAVAAVCICQCSPTDPGAPARPYCPQPKKLSFGQKKAHLMEIQVNGGSIAQKVDYGYGLFEKAVTVDSIFAANEMIDTIAISKVRYSLQLYCCCVVTLPSRLGWLQHAWHQQPL